MTAAPTILVNGAPRPLGDATTLARLLDALGVKAKKTAVERNGEIIPPAAFAATPVAPGDRIEIIQFVGGG
jgi:thiamine biosynthesis protein ThiS